MKRLFSVRALLPCLLPVVLAACTAMQPAPVEPSGPVQTTPPTGVVPPADPATLPQVRLHGVKTRAAFDKLAEARAKKGMKVKTRNASQMIVAVRLPNSKVEGGEEVRVIYDATSDANGLRITARVLQVYQPDSFKERVVDITRQTADRLQRELDDLHAALNG